MSTLDNELAKLLGWKAGTTIWGKPAWYKDGTYQRSAKDWRPSTRMDDAIYAAEQVADLLWWSAGSGTSNEMALATVCYGKIGCSKVKADTPAEALALAVQGALKEVGHR